MDETAKLIAEIYGAATDLSRWTTVVQKLHHLFPWGTTILYGYDNEAQCTLGMIQAGLSPELEQQFTSHYSLVSPFGSGIARAPLGIPQRSLDLCEWSLLAQSEYFNDFMLPRKSGAGVGLVLYREASRSLILTIDCNYQRRDEIEPRIIQQMNSIAYHMAQSFALMRKMTGQSMTRLNVSQLIDLVREPAFVLDRRCRIVVHNTAAARILEGNWAIRPSLGLLAFHNLDAQAFLEKAISSIRSNNINALASNYFLPSPLGRLVVSICPLAAQHPDAANPLFHAVFDNEPIACVVLTSIDVREGRNLEVAQKIFGLTPAEARLADAVSAGVELVEYAKQNQVSIHTVRNQLKSIFVKTDTARQVELALLLRRLSNTPQEKDLP
jgi:DNA-binding CsgD family transcriptional regulator